MPLAFVMTAKQAATDFSFATADTSPALVIIHSPNND
jgi:hypothetical protein